MRLSFELLNQADGTGQGWTSKDNNENPYSLEQLATIGSDPAAPAIKKITSIPSPYARLHLTQIAFEEGRNINFKDLPPVYKRAISHCLDVFELFYRYDGIYFHNHDIEVKKHSYVKRNLSDLHALTTSDIYNKALQLFRHNYGDSKFTNFFTISKIKNNSKHLIAVTSPFTMFSTPENIDVCCEIPLQDGSDGRILFQNNDDLNKNHWTGIENRSKDFQLFVYTLIEKYNSEYPSLYSYLTTRLKADFAGNLTFDNSFPQFTVPGGSVGIPLKVDAAYDHIEVLPRTYDKYLFEKNFIDLSHAIDLSHKDNEVFNEQLRRPFYERINIFSDLQNPGHLNWITIDDLLEDTIYVSPNVINTEKYLAHSDYPNIFLPLKKLYFQLYNLFDSTGALLSQDEINSRFEISERFVGDDAVSVERIIEVTLILPGEHDGNKVKITRQYKGNQIQPISIDFGIYPSIKVNKSLRSTNSSSIPENFYRLMLYLQTPLTNLDDDVKLFVADDETGLLKKQRIDSNTEGCYHFQRHSTITKNNFPELTDNLYYISMESVYEKPEKPDQLSPCQDVRFDFVELNLSKGRLLIVPRWEIYKGNNLTTNNIAVDLGTTNTFVAYGSGQRTEEAINSEVIVSKLCLGSNRNLDFTQNGYHQWCEFLPSKFGPNYGEAHFPIRTIQFRNPCIVSDNQMNKIPTSDDAPLVSMYSLSVPFLLEDTGSRCIGNVEVDQRISNFKWFRGDERDKMNSFTLFVDQICFMLRSTLLYQNASLSDVKLAWTYPLALTKLDLFQSIWSNAYSKYFGEPTPYNLISFTESETPINFSSCAEDTGDKVGIDIGGGTSDIILYKAKGNQGVNEISMATSFSFAGNAMFGQLGHNAGMKNSENIWYQVFKDFVVSRAVKSQGGMKRKIVDASDEGRNIADFMNFIFAHPMKENPVVVKDLLQTKPLMFINLYHITALLWEIAKVCKLRLGEDRVPKYIVFSGNGSKLILMSLPETRRNETIQVLVQAVFNVVYNSNRQQRINCANIKVELLEYPKQATSRGALVMMARNQITTKTDGKYFIPFIGNLYHKSYGLLTADIELSEDTGGPSVDPLTNPFAGGQFDDLFAPDPVTASTTEELIGPTTTFEEVNENRPFVKDILNHREEIIQEVAEFVEFFLNRLAVTPMGGQLTRDAIKKVKKEVFGIDTTYNTPIMNNLIEEAFDNIIEPQADGDRLNESVFLAVNGMIISEFIKYFANRKR